MVTAVVLFCLSYAAGLVSLWYFQSFDNVPFFLSVLSAIASAYLILRERFGGNGPAPKQAKPARQDKAGPQVAAQYVIVDGSNVLFWDRNIPSLDTLQRVLRAVEAEGMTPIIWFDANIGYKLYDRFAGEAEMARLCGLPIAQVNLAEAGMPADPLILADAENRGTRIVSNDNYYEWVQHYPILQDRNLLIKGAIRHGEAVLALTPLMAEV